MATSDSLNIIEILQRELAKRVKDAITEELVKEELAKIEPMVREIIKPLVEKVTFEKIERIQDFYLVRDDIKIFLKWDES